MEARVTVLGAGKAGTKVEADGFEEGQGREQEGKGTEAQCGRQDGTKAEAEAS